MRKKNKTNKQTNVFKYTNSEVKRERREGNVELVKLLKKRVIKKTLDKLDQLLF